MNIKIIEIEANSTFASPQGYFLCPFCGEKIDIFRNERHLQHLCGGISRVFFISYEPWEVSRSEKWEEPSKEEIRAEILERSGSSRHPGHCGMYPQCYISCENCPLKEGP